MNGVILSGSIASAPRCTYTQAGACRCSFILSVPRAGGREAKDYIPIVAWDKAAEDVRDFAGVGDRTEIKGELRTRKNTTANWVLEVRAEQIILPRHRGMKEVENVK